MGELRAAQAGEIERQGSPQGQADALIQTIVEGQARMGINPDVNTIKQTVDQLFGLTDVGPGPAGFTGPPPPPDPGIIDQVLRGAGKLFDAGLTTSPAFLRGSIEAVVAWKEANPDASVADFKAQFPIMSMFMEHNPSFSSMAPKSSPKGNPRPNPGRLQ